MEEDGFPMPNLSGQTTKTLQIQALRVVRTAAAASFKTLQDEETRLRRLFPNQNMSRGSIFATSAPPPPPPPPPPAAASTIAPPSPPNGQ